MPNAGHVTLSCQFCDTLNDVTLARHEDHPKCSSCKKPFRLDRPINVREDQFDKTVLEAGVPVLVDFHADWCGPCQTMSPTLDQIALDMAGKALVVKVNTDAAPTIGQRYGVRSIPYFVGFANGELAGTLVGVQSPEALRGLVESAD